MSASLELAEAYIDLANHGIESRTMTEQEIESVLASAREMLARAEAALRIDYIVAAGKVVLEHIEVLENIRRLLAFGVAGGGSVSRDQMALYALLQTKPQLDRSKGIHGIIPAAEWLQANRRSIASLLATIRAASDL